MERSQKISIIQDVYYSVASRIRACDTRYTVTATVWGDGNGASIFVSISDSIWYYTTLAIGAEEDQATFAFLTAERARDLYRLSLNRVNRVHIVTRETLREFRRSTAELRWS